MTETATPRIRWHDEPSSGMAACAGSVGTLDPAMFHIWRPDAYCAEWQLTTRLHSMEQRCYLDADPDELKAEAERWLEEFVSSLGAVFPEDAYEFEEDDEPLEVKFAAGTRVRFAHPDAGYPGEAGQAMKALTPGRVYTVAWADIGQSRTDLNLAGQGKPLGRFNSVLFEPVDDAEPVPPHPEEEAP